MLLLAMYAAQLAQASACMDKWSTLRCARQEKKGNCVAEAECPNPKKGGIKCTHARSKCQVTCGQCSADECAILVANLTSELEICTASSPTGMVSAGPCPLQAAITTTADGEQWCADDCSGRAVHIVVGSGMDFSSLATGVCVVVDATAGNVGQLTLTNGDDCMVVVGATLSTNVADEVGNVFAKAGNDLICGGGGVDVGFNGGDGDDTLYGGDGGDQGFFGGDGDDALYGGDGDDVYFVGGNGTDTLRGGPGEDESFFGNNYDGGDGDDDTDA